MDQNEKIGLFGATHVVAVDGFSSRIVAHVTMPIKNNVIIHVGCTGEHYTMQSKSNIVCLKGVHKDD